MVKLPLLARLAACATVLAVCVIALGAFTRLIDAGLGCPDWPGCYGHLTVPLSQAAQTKAVLSYPQTPLVSYKAWAEMIHRYFVGGLSLLILSLVGLIVTQKTYRLRTNIFLALLLVGLLIYQIMLGQWTVTLKLLPFIVTQHLLGGFLISAVLWSLYLVNRVPSSTAPKEYAQQRFLLGGAYLGLCLLICQIMLGAWTSTHYASLSCPDLPFCENSHPFLTLHLKAAFQIFSPIGINYEGGILPESIRQTIHMVHRLGALLLTVYLFSYGALAILQLKNNATALPAIYALLGLLILQICLGMSNVIFKLPLLTALLHTVTAALLLLTLITFIYRLTQLQLNNHAQHS